ncbi:PilZ domain-containing protein [Candidatus Omnitrophota bacterium]
MTEEQKFNERRRYVRFGLNTKINYLVRKEKAQPAATKKEASTSKNVSIEGVCFTSYQEMLTGTELDLEIFISNEEEPLLLRGQVKWSRPIGFKYGKPAFEVGVQLAALDDSDQNSYLRFIWNTMAKRLKKYSETSKSNPEG